jgi:transposase
MARGPTRCLGLTWFAGYPSPEGRSRQMPRKRPLYPAEPRRGTVELVRAGRCPGASPEVEPPATAICNWVAQAARDDGRRTDSNTAGEDEGLGRVCRQDRVLGERETIGTAAVWFAKETMSIASMDSSSGRPFRPSIPSPPAAAPSGLRLRVPGTVMSPALPAGGAGLSRPRPLVLLSSWTV